MQNYLIPSSLIKHNLANVEIPPPRIQSKRTDGIVPGEFLHYPALHAESETHYFETTLKSAWRERRGRGVTSILPPFNLQ